MPIEREEPSASSTNSAFYSTRSEDVVDLSSLEIKGMPRLPSQEPILSLENYQQTEHNNKFLKAYQITKRQQAFSTLEDGDPTIYLNRIQVHAPLFQSIPDKLKNNETFILAAVTLNARALKYTDFNDNTKVVLAAIAQRGMAIQHASTRLRNDLKIVLAAIRKHARVYQMLEEHLAELEQVALAAVTQDGRQLKHAPETIRENKAIVLAAVKQNGFAIEYASGVLQQDMEIIFAAIAQNGLLLDIASPEFKKNQDFVLAAVKQNGLALKYISKEWQEEQGSPEFLEKMKEILWTAVSQDGRAIQYVAPKWQSDIEIVSAAITQNSLALQYVSTSWQEQDNPELAQKIKELVLTAVSRNGWALEYVAPKWQRDIDIVLAAVRQDGNVHLRVLPEFKNHPQILLAAARTENWLLEYAPESFKLDREFVLAAVIQNGLALEYFPAIKTLENYEEIVLAAVKQNGMALQFTPEELMRSPKVARHAVTQNGLVLEHIDGHQGNFEVVHAAVSENGLALEHALNRPPHITLAAVKQNGLALQYASEKSKSKLDVVLAAIAQNGLALEHACDAFRANPELQRITALDDSARNKACSDYLIASQQRLPVERKETKERPSSKPVRLVPEETQSDSLMNSRPEPLLSNRLSTLLTQTTQSDSSVIFEQEVLSTERSATANKNATQRNARMSADNISAQVVFGFMAAVGAAAVALAISSFDAINCETDGLALAGAGLLVSAYSSFKFFRACQHNQRETVETTFDEESTNPRVV